MSKLMARALRRRSTDAERALWIQLRNRQLDGAKFRRQVPIGQFVVDFFCLNARLIVEVDGGQHANDQDRDAKRTAWLTSEGYKVFRVWNNDVLENSDGVLEAIRAALQKSKPLTQQATPASLSPKGRGDFY